MFSRTIKHKWLDYLDLITEIPNEYVICIVIMHFNSFFLLKDWHVAWYGLVSHASKLNMKLFWRHVRDSSFILIFTFYGATPAHAIFITVNHKSVWESVRKILHCILFFFLLWQSPPLPKNKKRRSLHLSHSSYICQTSLITIVHAPAKMNSLLGLLFGDPAVNKPQNLFGGLSDV